MQTLKTKTLFWYHLHRPSRHDLEGVAKRCSLHPLVAEELTHPTMRPKAERYDSHLYLVLHFPIFSPSERKTHPREVDFVVTRREIVTVTYDAIPPLDDFFRKCSAERSCEDLYASKTPAHLLYHILRELYAFALRELDHIQENVERIEEEIFSGREREVVEELSIARRDIIDFRRSTKPQLITLESLGREGVAFFGEPLRPFFDGLLGEFSKVWDLLENNKEALEALYDNNATLLNIRQNDIMKVLTIMAFVTFPLMLMAALFSMDTVYTPIVGSRYDFWVILGIMVAAMIIMYLFFKRKRWL